MNDRPVSPLTSHFSKLTDPRMDRTKRHNPTDVAAAAICAVVCGADSWVDVELFGKSKREWRSGFLELPNGIPSRDTFGRVFSVLDAGQFQNCFIGWVADYVLALRDNQPGLGDAVAEVFRDGRRRDFAGMDSDCFETMEPVKTIQKDSRWEVEELIRVFPATLGIELYNPAPAPPPGV